MQTKVPSPIDVHVGSQIRMRRKIIGMSQSALGEKLGITFQQVQKYEKGTNRVGASRLQGIANILGVEVSALFNGLAPTCEPDSSSGNDMAGIQAFLTSSDGFALNQAFAKIKNGTVRRRIVALVSSLAQSEIKEAEGTVDDL